MKKYILPLILIFILTFILIGNCAWLSGWDKRIKLTTDNTKIDTANLTWFPVTVFLTGSQAEEIFSELDADADYMKVAFTKADGTTELYAECELFDHSESLGIYHISRDGWVIAYDADTDFYMYYDNDHADNDTYIGAINTTAGAAVWDASFKFVCHMVDATTSTVLDSTSNDNDGTKTSANNPNEIAGDIGISQDFGGDDYINVNHSAELSASDYFTVEIMGKIDIAGNYSFLIKADDLASAADNYSYRMYITTQRTMYFGVSQTGAYNDEANVLSTDTLSTNTLYYLAGKNNGTNISLFIDDSKKNTSSALTVYDSTSKVHIGTRYDDSESIYKYFLDGKIDEVRISNIARADAWMNATCDSLKDTLLTYGSEETEEEEANAIFFGTNF